jgi:hypothetical protein
MKIKNHVFWAIACLLVSGWEARSMAQSNVSIPIQPVALFRTDISDAEILNSPVSQALATRLNKQPKKYKLTRLAFKPDSQKCISLSIPGDTTLIASFYRIEEGASQGCYSWIGYVEGSACGAAVITVKGDKVMGTIDAGEKRAIFWTLPDGNCVSVNNSRKKSN